MIKLENISKDYISSKGTIVQALKNISLSFPETGMVFINGKSGSGKTTLLNILGLLDRPTNGKIIINGIDTTVLNNDELSIIRGSKLGFVFQEYNLIPNLSVYDNIILPLKINNNDVSIEINNNVFEKLGIKELLHRRVENLSGGQRQRVAIARALIKGSKILLCDEPTGALDNYNSENLLTLLKELSQNILVVIVSHDYELTNKYADYTIDICEGIIKSDLIQEINSDENKSEIPVLRKGIFSVKEQLKLGKAFIRKHILSVIISCFLSIIAFILVGFSFNMLTFSSNDSIVNSLKKNNINYFVYTPNSYYYGLNDDEYLTKSDNDYEGLSLGTLINLDNQLLGQKHYLYQANIDTTFTNSYLIGNIEYIVPYDSSIPYSIIHGASPKKNEILITSMMYELYKIYGYNKMIITDFSDIIGKELKGTDNTYTISGIIEVPYDKSLIKNIIDMVDNNKIDIGHNISLEKELSFIGFVNEDDLYEIDENEISFSLNNYQFSSNKISRINENIETHYFNNNQKNIIIDINLMCLSLYNKSYEELLLEYELNDYTFDQAKKTIISSIINESNKEKLVMNLPNVKGQYEYSIDGFYISDTNEMDLMVNENLYDTLISDFISTNVKGMLCIYDKTDLRKGLLTSLVIDENRPYRKIINFNSSAISNIIGDVESTIGMFKGITLTLGIAFIIISMIIMVYFQSVIMKKNKYRYGVLMSLGVKKTHLYFISSFHIFIEIIVSIVVSSLLILFSIKGLNNYLVKKVDYNLVIIKDNPFVYLIITVITILCCSLGSLIPSIRFNKKMPYEVINSSSKN